MTFDHLTLGQRVLFATGGAADAATTAVEGLGASRVLLIAGGSAIAVADAIAARVPVAVRIGKVVQHVPVENARVAVELARTERVDAAVAVGGGSATGLAKIVARDADIPIVAVPTTFSGSEATNVWGETDDGRKTTGVDDRVLPRVVVYDAALLRSLPAALTVASGLNAVAHAVDSLWAPRADPINTALGMEGLRALVRGIHAVVASPYALESREQMLYGAYLAAVAFASAGSGMHHKICHVIGGVCGLPHAETHAIVLPYVTAFVTPAAPDAAERISQALEGAPAAAGLFALRRDAGVTGSLSELGMREQDIPRVTQQSFAAIPASSPRPVTLGDVEGVVRAAFRGDPIKEE